MNSSTQGMCCKKCYCGGTGHGETAHSPYWKSCCQNRDCKCHTPAPTGEETGLKKSHNPVENKGFSVAQPQEEEWKKSYRQRFPVDFPPRHAIWDFISSLLAKAKAEERDRIRKIGEDISEEKVALLLKLIDFQEKK